MQVTGVGPLAALQQHLADPINTTIFSKAAVIPGAVSQPPCAIEPVHNFQVRSTASRWYAEAGNDYAPWSDLTRA